MTIHPTTFVLLRSGGFLVKKMLKWKNSSYRKPLVVNGARQVGKTWIIKEFGNLEYENMAYINCDNNPVTKDLFYDFDIERIIRSISAITTQTIKKGKTLIVFDEIQECPLGLTALKYFYENAPEYHIVVAGSLLGISIHQGTGFPVGKTDQLNVYPMSFKEFLIAMNKESFVEILENHNWNELAPLHNSFVDLLRQYYYVGGMPEVVYHYVETQDIQQVRIQQKKIISDYNRDFSKHIPEKLLAKVKLVWNSIPSQLAKENKKFIYGALRKGGRAKEFEDAIQWLLDAGLIYKVNRVSKVSLPTSFYEDVSAFKLFISDLGLLGAMVDAPAKQVLIGNNIFKEYKRAFTEQYVAQQIISSEVTPYYYTNDNSTNEIDFVVQLDSIYPIEVKAEENLKSKSLNKYLDENENNIAWRFSMSNYRKMKQIINVPLYCVEEWIKQTN